jgi:hypothetical protein
MKRFLSGLLASVLIVTLAHAQGKVTLRISTEKKQKAKTQLKQKGDVNRGQGTASADVQETSQDVEYTVKIQNMAPTPAGSL